MLHAILISLLILIAFQDVLFRGIHWVFFPALLITTLLVNRKTMYWEMIVYNALLLFFMLMMITLYVSLKHGKLVNITTNYFALGDILFMAAIIPLFDTQWYLWFFTFGALISLVLHGIATLIKPQSNLPFAGYMAMVGVLYVLFKVPLHNYLDPT